MIQEWRSLIRDLRPHLIEVRKQVSESWSSMKAWWRKAYVTKMAIMGGAAVIWFLSGLEVIARPPIAGYMYFGALGVIVFVAATSPIRRRG